MIYDIRHITTYRYAAPVASAACVLRLLPRDEAGQTVLDSGLEISPRAAETHSSIDAFGNLGKKPLSTLTPNVSPS